MLLPKERPKEVKWELGFAYIFSPGKMGFGSLRVTNKMRKAREFGPQIGWEMSEMGFTPFPLPLQDPPKKLSYLRCFSTWQKTETLLLQALTTLTASLHIGGPLSDWLKHCSTTFTH